MVASCVDEDGRLIQLGIPFMPTAIDKVLTTMQKLHPCYHRNSTHLTFALHVVEELVQELLALRIR